MVSAGFGVEISIQNVLDVAHGEKVQLSKKTDATLKTRRSQIEAFIQSQETPAYGFNRGFGHNVDTVVPANKLAELQKNLIRSHSSGIGEPASVEIVRAAMFLRAQSLSLGHSGVRPEVVNALVDLLNAKITPVVPRFGSVGASGDLAPLSHIALALIGEGNVFVGDSMVPVTAGAALKKAGLKPLTLQMKEGLALNNGVQFSTACGILAYEKMKELLHTAVVATAMSCQVMLGNDSAYLEKLHELRPHRGARIVAKWLWDLMQDSPMREAHRPHEVDGEVQDPYNLRCAAQILGTCYDLIEEAGETFTVEINSVTDNPLLLEEDSAPGQFTSIVSGGNFHGMPIAVKIYNLMQASAIMARLSNMRCVRYVDEARNKGLGSDLIWPGLSGDEKSASSGMMIPEYASAALTNVIWGEMMPSHLFSLSTDAGQEDHVSMSAGLGVRMFEILPRLAEVLAIELAYVSQAAAIRRNSETIPSIPHDSNNKEVAKAKDKLKKTIAQSIDAARYEAEVEVHLKYKWKKSQRTMSPISEKVLSAIAKHFPTVKADQELATPLTRLSTFVVSGGISKLVAAKLS